MTAPTLALNALAAISVRLLTPETGVWIADVDYDLAVAAAPAALTGPALLTIGAATLQGTIDPRGSSRFGAFARARVVGGGNGWDKTVAPKHWHNDAGVLSTTFLTSTAAEVGERLVDGQPSRLGIDVVRSAGPASRVLAGMHWFVDYTGTTVVGTPRVPATPGPDVSILSWEPLTARAELAADSVIAPGTVLTDTRFDTVTVRDVEQTFNADGARATCWCAPTAVSRLSQALSNLVRERGGIAFLKSYRYRVVAQRGDGRLDLQAVTKAAGVPDSIAISPWFGAPGDAAKVTPGTLVALVFLDGNPTTPVVAHFDGTLPLERTVDAAAVTHIGPSSPIVEIAGGGPTQGAARVGDQVGPFTISTGSLKTRVG